MLLVFQHATMISLVGPDGQIGSVYVSLRDTPKMVDFIALQRRKACDPRNPSEGERVCMCLTAFKVVEVAHTHFSG